jgi:hypothetical protein
MLSDIPQESFEEVGKKKSEKLGSHPKGRSNFVRRAFYLPDRKTLNPKDSSNATDYENNVKYYTMFIPV